MRERLGRVGRMLLAGITAIVVMLTGAVGANAANVNGYPGYYWDQYTNGSHHNYWRGEFLGVEGYYNGHAMYCIESGVSGITTSGTWSKATSENGKKAAYIVSKHESDTSDTTQAAVAWAVHELLDSGSNWTYVKNNVGLIEGGDKATVKSRAESYLDDADENMPAKINASYAYTEGQRTGTFNPGILNSSGSYVSGLSYTLTISGPAVWSSTGTKTYSGTTSGSAQHIKWEATGNGDVTVTVKYDQPIGETLDAGSNQDMFAYLDDPETQSGSISFEVVNAFQPTVTTESSSKELKRGETVQDKVTSGVEDGDEWISGVEVLAEGFYFVGTEDQINQVIDLGEYSTKPKTYVNHVEEVTGLEYVATASATFTKAGQTKTVTAESVEDGSDYVNREDGMFGTWVWYIRLEDQTGDNADYLKAAYIDPFGQVSESSIHSGYSDEWSEVVEATGETGSSIMDVIHLSNVPADLGDFEGDDDYGYTADNTKVTVEVWWAGSGTSNKSENLEYKPTGEDTPTEDDNHKLVGSYEYDLAQIISDLGPNFDGDIDIRVGGGSSGTPLADGSTFEITADQTGWYTFVFKYDGCSRFEPYGYQSAYDDEYESVFITEEVPQISLISNTNPASVKVGEEFWDTATISGTGTSEAAVGSGAYVVFDAYNPTNGSATTSVGKLLDTDIVYLTDDQIDDLNNGKQVTVDSTHITAVSSGYVYWKASLYDKDGILLATHELGIASETTTILGAGTVESTSQKQGAVDGQMWDIITVADASDGNIPDGSTVEVSVYKHEGQNAATSGQLVETKTFTVDTGKLGDRPGSYSFQAVMDGSYPAAGTYYWVAKLIDPNGNILDEGEYGEDSERTYVQEYETDASKAWLSANDSEYAQSTIDTFDVLTQTYYTMWGEDDQTGASTAVYFGATASGTQAQFTLWHQEDSGGDTTVQTGDLIDLDRIRDVKEPYSQKTKSETFTLPTDTATGSYYYTVKVTNTQDAENLAAIGVESDGLVWESEQRVERETFTVVRVTSDAAEPIVTTDMPHIQETLHVDGTLEAGSSYQVELWTVGDDDKTETLISKTSKITLDSGVTDDDITVVMDTPSDPGEYQFRFKVWSPDDKGDDPDIEDSSVEIPDDWVQGDYYQDAPLLYEGDSVESERFNLIRIDTDVTGTTNMHTSDGEHYVDVTDGADVNDHATITGNLDRDGYRLGFELYRNDGGSEDDDTLVATVTPTDLAAATSELDSAIANLTEPGDYYWVTVFSKSDGSVFLPDGQTEIRSAKRVESESFHAVRITTTTYKWSSVGGELSDVALIEGTLPDDTVVGFELHDYDTGDLVAETEDSILSDMDGFEEGADSMSVTSPSIMVDESGDYYWVEWVRIPDDDQGEDAEFHRGNDRVDYESTRTIAVNTTTFTEIHLGTAIGDDTDLENINYETDIRDDYVDGELDVSWEVWRQGDGDVDSDTLLDTLEGGSLAQDQTEAVSPVFTPDTVGVYYFRVRVTADDGTLVAYGEAREPSETVRVVDSESDTIRVVVAGEPINDTVTITGPVLEGTMVSWQVFRQDDDGDTLVADWDTPENGAYVITTEDAQTAADTGSVTVTSPLSYEDTQAGEIYYFVYSLTAPARDEDGTPLTGTIDEQTGYYTTDHLADYVADAIYGDDLTAETDDTTTDAADEVEAVPLDADGETVDSDEVADTGTESESDEDTATVSHTPFHTDMARVEDETAYIIEVTTQTNEVEDVSTPIHDTALITGTIPDDTYCVEFELWHQSDSDDVDDDRLVTTTECVPVTEGVNPTVDSPDVTVEETGTYYWRERLIHDKNGEDEREVDYGDARVTEETVNLVDVTTSTADTATTGDGIHDTALIEGTIPSDSYCVEFELWEQSDSDNADDDTLITTTECVVVPQGTDVTVDSPDVTVDTAGTYYWRERLIHDKGGADEREIAYGDARVPGETVKVSAPLAQTGVTGAGVIACLLLLAMTGVEIARRRKRA